MNREPVTYTVQIHYDPEFGYEGEVAELPGCFAAGATLDDLHQSLEESISLYLSTPDEPVVVRRRPDGELMQEKSTFELCDA